MVPKIARLFDFCDLHVSRWHTLPITAGFISRPMYYDPEGFPIGSDGRLPAVLVWGRMMQDANLRRLAWDALPDGSYLSTVWLGLDHAHGFGPPLIFETMRMGAHPADDSPHLAMPFPNPFGEPGEETEQLRYTTAEEAFAAHHEVLRRLRLRLGS